VVISGTSSENIAGGRLAERFPAPARQNLFLGLGRGAKNYSFDQEGKVSVLEGILPNKEERLALHRVCFELHEHLLANYDFPTDIVFTRENYCKIDLIPELIRGQLLCFHGNDLAQLNQRLALYGCEGGVRELFDLALSLGEKYQLQLFPTTDAKYLELGFGTKSDNVNAIFRYLQNIYGISAAECCFWGDEFLEMGEGIFGSDACMITKATSVGDFFDVSDVEGKRPAEVCWIGGGVERFHSFLYEQVAQK
jgi:hypothetical protein